MNSHCPSPMPIRYFDFGERKALDFIVSANVAYATVVIQNATWELCCGDDVVLRGDMEIDGTRCSVLLAPPARGEYLFKGIFNVSDETIIEKVLVRCG